MFCVFDGGLSVQEYNVPQASSLPSVATLRTEFIRGEGMGGGVGGMVYSITTNGVKCSHSNHRGDVIARSNDSGSLTSFALYEAYGTRPYEWGDDPDRQKANTKEEETDLGLLNEGMRFRDLETGTFLTRDPLGYADNVNVYCYVRCNPISYFDSLGLGTIRWQRGSSATDADLALAQKQYSEALDRKMPDGTKPISVQRMEWLASDDNPHDITITVTSGDNTCKPDPGKDGDAQTKGVGSGSQITYNPNKTEPFKSDGVKRDPESSLVHELAGHAAMNARGAAKDHGTDAGFKNNELCASMVENTHRFAKGEDLREKYGKWNIPTPNSLRKYLQNNYFLGENRASEQSDSQENESKDDAKSEEKAEEKDDLDENESSSS